MKPNPDEDALRPTYRMVGLVGVLLSACAWIWGNAALGFSAAVGAGLATANLWVLARTVRNLLIGSSPSWGGVAALKFLALLGITYLALNNQHIDALGFALGIFALPLGIVIAGLLFPPNDKHHHTVKSSSAKTDNA